MPLLRPKIILANGYEKSGVSWLTYQLCWLLDAQQGGPELRRNIKHKPNAARRFEVHEGHYRAGEVPGYVSVVVLTIRNPLDVIVAKYFNGSSGGNIQACVDAVCYNWATWYESYANYGGYDDHADLIRVSYETMQTRQREMLNRMHKGIQRTTAPRPIVDRVLEADKAERKRRKMKADDYHNFLSEAQIAQVYRRLGAMMQEVGYEVEA